MHVSHRTAKRLPPPAERSSIPPDALYDFDRAMTYVQKYSEEGNSAARNRPWVDGRPYAYDYRTAFTQAPRLAMALVDACYVVNSYQGQPGWFSPSDHEWIDLVLGCDSGYWAFHAGHTANAAVTGVRIEAMRALHQGRDEDLTDEERQCVEFIRAVRDGGMTDEIWNRMTERLGSVQGTIGYAFLVCMLWSTMRMMGAFGVAAIEEQDWYALIDDYDSGARDPAVAAQDWIWDTTEKSATAPS
jgi:hypothetical protein